MNSSNSPPIYDSLRDNYGCEEIFNKKCHESAMTVETQPDEIPQRRTAFRAMHNNSSRFEATISSLENARDLSKINLTELLNALRSQG